MAPDTSAWINIEPVDNRFPRMGFLLRAIKIYRISTKYRFPNDQLLRYRYNDSKQYLSPQEILPLSDWLTLSRYTHDSLKPLLALPVSQTSKQDCKTGRSFNESCVERQRARRVRTSKRTCDG